MDVLGIVLSLFLLMYMAYMGFSVILFAPVFALLAASLQGLPVMPSYTELFMAKAVVYVKSFFPVFMLGAVFGKVMEDTLLAKGISHAVMQKLGHKHAILAQYCPAEDQQIGLSSAFCGIVCLSITH